jgi:hypothetical protein
MQLASAMKWNRAAVILSGTVMIAASLACAREARAQEEGTEESVAMRANTGLNLGLAPMVLLPARDNGPWGGGLDVQGRYGLRVWKTVVAPGAMLGGYTISGRLIGLAMPTLRWTIPIGPLAPYGVGGIGYGGITNPGDSGLGWLAGGGLMIHFGHVVGIGAELTYRAITGTDYGALVLGPQISFGG